MARLRAIGAAAIFCGVLVAGTGLASQQRKGAGAGLAPAVRSLIEARIKVAQEVFEAALVPPLNGPLDDLPAWSRRWMDDQTSLTPDDPSRGLAAIRGHLDRIKNLEAIAAARKEGARGTQADALKMKYYRLEAEQMLEELRIINPGLFTTKPDAGS